MRVVIVGVRRGGDLRAVSATRSAVLSWTMATGVALVMIASSGLLPWAAPVAAAPGLAAAVCLAVFPPPPLLRSVGWTLVLVCAVAALILIEVAPAAG